MNRIRLLSEQVANQIAAGEVVERPASVVKELVENALDANATRITVEIQAGGRSLIRVTDDGIGMSRDDALLCLERHATSKIQRAEDLTAISTLGFRGEALPSIASVSRMTLTTRERESGTPAATQVNVSGGKLLDVKEAGSPPGTCVEVRQLFFNLPARRKFLRTEETEYAHIHHYLILAALAHPEVALTFSKDARVVWHLAGVRISEPAAALRERMRALFGDEQKLLAVDFTGRIDDEQGADPTEDNAQDDTQSSLRLWGYIGSPGVSRATREDQHLFVNRRPVENRALNFALIEGYHTVLMKGRYPVCCLFLELDPASVDVNIHPAKREVKFHNERAVRRWVAHAVRQTLVAFHTSGARVANAEDERGNAESPSNSAVTPKEAQGNAQSPRTPLPDIPALWPVRTALLTPRQPPAQQLPPNPKSEIQDPKETRNPKPEAIRARTPDTRPSDFGSHSSGSQQASPVPDRAAGSQQTPLLNVPLRLVGVIGKLYVVLESDRGLVLMDQHAAHERVLFEQMLARLESGNVPSQRLLLPQTVELSVRDASFLREQLPTLTRLGVGLSEFGERTFLLDALPPLVKGTDARRFVLELIDGLKAAGQEINSHRLGEETIVKTVCRHAVKANDPLTGRELENLVNDLRHCAMPYTCPHGRPTLIEMNFRELEKKFGRSA